MTPLHSTPQWVVVKLVPLPTGKTDKIPLHYLTGEACDAHDPANWTTYEAAVALAGQRGAGHTVGFVLTAADPFFCVDIDGAATPNGWSALSQQIVASLPGCCVEVSQSGKGLHVWGRYANPPEHRKKRVDLGVECYTARRFIAIGHSAVGEIAEHCHAFGPFLAQWFPPAPASEHGGDGPRPDWRGPTDDADLIRRALRSTSTASAFGASDRASFSDLWTRNLAVLAKAYRGDGDGGVDWSSADQALAQHLAFWTGCDAERMERLMRQSQLVRDKWEREDYLPRTIASACRMQRDVLQDKPIESPLAEAQQIAPRSEPPAPAAPAVPDAAALAVPAVAAGSMQRRTGATFVTAADAMTMFAGCFYVADHHRVLLPGGKLYKPEQMKSVFGGHVFSLDERNEKTTRDAFEAFTANQVVKPPIVDGTCFRPDLPFGTIITTEGRSRVNCYWPANVRRVKGDASRFLRHMQILLPKDWKLSLYWMANTVQHPGHKSQWMPLIVGPEGNGKSLFSRCLAYAVGQRYTHWPTANKLGGQFNGWMFGRLLACIEDLKITDRAEVWETLKPMITGESLEIEQKGIDQRTDEVCVVFIANSNHRDAIRATKNDRRVCHLWCAQETADDLIRDGITEQYISSLYDWLKNEDGYAIVADYLATLPIPPEFGLSWYKGRAPHSSAHKAALTASWGPIEQEIQEAIERGEVGFRGGWVSSAALERLLSNMHRSLPPNKRREAMQALGYDWHPALKDGRVNNPVMPDGTKVKLFVLHDSPARAITSPAEVAAAYSAAQGVTR